MEKIQINVHKMIEIKHLLLYLKKIILIEKYITDHEKRRSCKDRFLDKTIFIKE